MKKFKVNAKKFVDMAKDCTKGGAKDPLGTAVLSIEGDNLCIRSQTNTSFFEGKVLLTEKDGTNEGDAWGVNIKKLLPILKVIPTQHDDLELLFEFGETMSFEIKFFDSILKLPILNNPVIPTERVEKKLGTVNDTDFLNTMNKVLKVVSDVMDNSPASCLHIKTTKDKLVFMGTCRIILAEVKIDFVPGEDFEENAVYLIASPQAQLLSTAPTGKDITLVANSSRIGFEDSTGNFLSLVSLSNTTDIKYQSILDKATTDLAVGVETSMFKDAVNSIENLCSDAMTIELQVKMPTLKVKSENGDVLSIPIVSSEGIEDDTEYSIRFNRRNFTSFFNLLDDKTIIKWNSEKTQAVSKIEVADENDNVKENISIVVIQAGVK